MIRPSVRSGALGALTAVTLGVTSVLAATPAAAAPADEDFTLTILHNNDGESQLLGAPADPDFGGIARFVTLVRGLREAEARAPGSGVVTLSSGDNYLAGPQFAASLQRGCPSTTRSAWTRSATTRWRWATTSSTSARTRSPTSSPGSSRTPSSSPPTSTSPATPTR